ncbi:uncharacterized protein [Dasypus novemcinctus]|uniref:uncharacterized protein isoform X4 n=1 Tax=Dasypus novemcinctus TaxID=9361 RepID=UPI0039C99386
MSPAIFAKERKLYGLLQTFQQDLIPLKLVPWGKYLLCQPQVEHRFYPGQYGCKRALSFPRTALHELPHERPSATDAEIWATHSTLVTSQASASNWICSSTSTWTYSSTFPFLTCSSISTAHAAPPPPRPAATPFFFDLQLHFYLHLQFHLHLDLQLHLLFFNI